MLGKSLSVVVLNHNGKAVLSRCLAAARRSLPSGAELVVVDNGSTDGSGSAATTFGARLVRANNEHQFITGLNTAFTATDRKWVLFLQNDVLLRPETIANLSESASIFRVNQPLLLNEDGTVNHAGVKYVWPGVGLGLGYGQSSNPLPHLIPVFSTACFLMHRSVYDHVGPFDIHLAPAYYEDVDYSLRWGESYLVPKAIATHLSTFTFHRTHSKAQLAAICQRNRRYVVRKHYRGIDQWMRLRGLDVVGCGGQY